MSRIANQPISVPNGVTLTQENATLVVKGPKGELQHNLHPLVAIEQADSVITVRALESSKNSIAQSGTARALINNMVTGVSKGFEKRLTLIGVGYRAKIQGRTVEMTLGFSHPIHHELPEGVTVEAVSQTELLVKGCDKQLVGQVAADLRAYRPPEPYKGKGVRYSDEQISLKEAKKK